MKTGYRDRVIIPDRYNTGPQIPDEMLTPILDIIPNWGGYIAPNNVSQIFDENYVCEGVLFNTGQITFDGRVDHAVTFKNCKFTGENVDNSHYAMINVQGWTDNDSWIFDHCEFCGYLSACVQPHDRTIYQWCKIHMMNADGGKGGYSDGGYDSCLFYDLGRGGEGVHADGIQTTNYQRNFYIKNCRFDVPTTIENMSNAGLFYSQEEDSINCNVSDILIFGGGYSTYFGKKYDTVTYVNFKAERISIGHGERYGLLSASEEFTHFLTDGTITRQDKLFVSSVENHFGTLKIHVTNYTNSARTLVVVTENGTQNFTILGNLSWEDGHDKTLDNYHFDDEITVNGSWCLCYDTSITNENQVRCYMSYDTVDGLFTAIGDAVRSKRSETEIYKRQDLPELINGIETGITPTGTISVTTNGTVDVTNYASANVNVPQPSGSQTFTANGTYDVTAIAQAIINVSGGGSGLPSNVHWGIVSANETDSSIVVEHGFQSQPAFGMFQILDMSLLVGSRYKVGGRASFISYDIDPPQYSYGTTWYTNYRNVLATSANTSQADIEGDDTTITAIIKSDSYSWITTNYIWIAIGSE